MWLTLRFRAALINIKNVLLKVKYHYLFIKYLQDHLVQRLYNHVQSVQGKILFEALKEQIV